MLAGVLLHVIKAARPVDAAINDAGRYRTVHHVQDVVVFQVANIENIGFTELAEVVGLTSRGGIEMGLIE